ncbi:thiamine pyrophosphokinase [Mucilaginibacter robiniae]|uniref:Thiamine pyrophosphokinase n=1 Tax=Mucilaginibacter robiniae TaxID=2728022 RepID=A0A7L5E4P8_9SPHI|nr:thiamine pyrophosphokinase [Mucilaginibacter robiniae]QJD96704.1 thiamine pyrophosphokinase [Mucilaginibacter robiniae]
MSSHHIIREKQEPALLVFSLAHFSDEELGQLLEWSPTILTTGSTAEQLAVYGIKVDYVIGDNSPMLGQAHVKAIALAGQNELEAALNFLVEQGYPAVNMLTDELNWSVYEAYVPRINLVVFYQGQKIYAVNSGFWKWKPKGEKITLLTPVTNLQTTGLTLVGPQQYQTLQDGFLSLQFNEPQVFIAEDY